MSTNTQTKEWKKHYKFKLLIGINFMIIISCVLLSKRINLTARYYDFADSQNVKNVKRILNEIDDAPKLIVATEKEENETTYNSDLIYTTTSAIHNHLYSAEPNQTCEHEFPSCILIGVFKCGTRELMDFISMHPNVRIKTEPYEFNYFGKGNYRGDKTDNEWFRRNMPCIYKDQMTLLKHPGHYADPKVPERIYKFNKDMKMILMVREPVRRFFSHVWFEHPTFSFAQMNTFLERPKLSIFNPIEYRNGTYKDRLHNGSNELNRVKTSSWNKVNGDKNVTNILKQRVRRAAVEEDEVMSTAKDNVKNILNIKRKSKTVSVPDMNREYTHSRVNENVRVQSHNSTNLNNETKWNAGKQRPRPRPIPRPVPKRLPKLDELLQYSIYDEPYERYMKYFKPEKILIIWAEEFKTDPLTVLSKIETFLNLPHKIPQDRIVYHSKKKYYCIKSLEGKVVCYGTTRGRDYNNGISSASKEKLRSYFKPHNERFFELIGKRFDWDD